MKLEEYFEANKAKQISDIKEYVEKEMARIKEEAEKKMEGLQSAYALADRVLKKEDEMYKQISRLREVGLNVGILPIDHRLGWWFGKEEDESFIRGDFLNLTAVPPIGDDKERIPFEVDWDTLKDIKKLSDQQVESLKGFVEFCRQELGARLLKTSGFASGNWEKYCTTGTVIIE